jgi:hypothetical protein
MCILIEANMALMITWADAIILSSSLSFILFSKSAEKFES